MAAAVEMPKVEKAKRVSTMNEAHIVGKLQSVVSADDPNAPCRKVRKDGQRCVTCLRCGYGWMLMLAVQCVRACVRGEGAHYGEEGGDQGDGPVEPAGRNWS